ncbi:hypothetical protein NE237_028195 [Protea cynaroides]|uniref:Uncharacterized protein n=1 Tax=Protea cynaroides TaxID=273540 RepID=A0A9Q0JV30_9MAGN|nr:hypothetical protein NE237_028195 [Protea cynaroides]
MTSTTYSISQLSVAEHEPCVSIGGSGVGVVGAVPSGSTAVNGGDGSRVHEWRTRRVRKKGLNQAISAQTLDPTHLPLPALARQSSVGAYSLPISLRPVIPTVTHKPNRIPHSDPLDVLSNLVTVGDLGPFPSLSVILPASGGVDLGTAIRRLPWDEDKSDSNHMLMDGLWYKTPASR